MRRKRKQGRTRRRRRARSYPLQLAGAATLVAVAVWVLAVVVEKVAHPYWLGHTVGREVADLRAQLARQRARNALFRAQISYLRSAEGTETTARRAGWRRPGEEVYLLRLASETPAGASAPGEER